MMAEWNQQGRLLSLSPLQSWYCDQMDDNDEDWANLSAEERTAIEKDFLAPYGDRRQELVIIGTHLREQEFTTSLNACLLTDEELAEHDVHHSRGCYWDPLPPWVMTLNEESLFSAVLRPQQPCSWIVDAGFELSLNNLALHVVPVTAAENTVPLPVVVKVWLDNNEEVCGQSALLCLLRAGVMDHAALTIVVPPLQAVSTLRMEVLQQGHHLSSSAVEVHVLGRVVATSVGKDDDEEEEEDEV
jgi:hypothetical protein